MPLTENEQTLMELIMNTADTLGWLMAVPETTDGDDNITGIIIGTKEFVMESTANKPFIVFDKRKS